MKILKKAAFFGKRLLVFPSICKTALLRRHLKGTLLHVADIGATGGPANRWKSIKDLCHFFTFDLHPDAKIQNEDWNLTNFQTGLWSRPEKKTFYLMSFPMASTVYEFDMKQAEVFSHLKGLKKITSCDVFLKPLDEVLPKNVALDFLKVDAEGADLEILRGAEKYLNNTCLGVQVESFFVSLHKNGPLFGDIDAELRKRGFVLFDLIDKTRWLRKNQVFGWMTRSQYVCCNLIYILKKEIFFNRMKTLTSDQRHILFTKYMSFLLLFQFHDYAEEIRRQALSEKLISEKLAFDLGVVLNRTAFMKFSVILRLIIGILVSLVGVTLFVWISPIRRRMFQHMKYLLEHFVLILLNLFRSNSTVSEG